MADAISITSLSVRYPGTSRPALTDVSFSVPGGSCCAILGPTGAGKSTLLQALAGVLGAHHKQVKAEGIIDIGSSRFEGIPPKILFPHVGLFLQDPTVQITGIRETVEDEVRFALDNLMVDDGEAQARVRRQLEALHLEHLAKRSLTQLSGGELQRVALAGMLVAAPSVVLLDEPLNSLDATAQAQLIRVLASDRTHRTVVLTDYGIDAALRLADTVIILDHGRLLFRGSVAGMIERAEEFTDVLPAEVLTRISPLLEGASEAHRRRRAFIRLMEAE